MEVTTKHQQQMEDSGTFYQLQTESLQIEVYGSWVL